MNLPTPTVADSFTDKLKSSQQSPGSMHSVSLSQAARMLFDSNKDWGKYRVSIERWEIVTGLHVPPPLEEVESVTRLSSKFTEWMMGLEAGWVTGRGLSRKDELKACGNGVVPQQAELALRLLMEGKK